MTRDDKPSPWAILAATVQAGAILVAALRGGSYDVVARSEHFVGVLWVLGLGLTLGLRCRRPSYTLLVAAAALGGLGTWAAVGLLWTDSPQRTLEEVARIAGFLGVLLLASAMIGPDNWRIASAALTVVLVLVCALALVTRIAPDVLTSPLSTSGFERRRLSYPFAYWNALGAWTALTVALTLAWSAHARHWWVRGAALGAAATAGTVTYLTYSRAATAAVVLAVAAVVALSRHRWLTAAHATVAAGCTAVMIGVIRDHPAIAEGTGTAGRGALLTALAGMALASLAAAAATSRARLEHLRMPRRTARLSGAIAAGALLLAAASVGPAAAERAWDSFRNTENPQPADAAERLTTLSGGRHHLWSVALRAFSDEPLTGTGAGTFEFVSNTDPERREYVRDAHSLYLETLTELGVPGLLLLAMALSGLVVVAVRAARTRHIGADAGILAGCAAGVLAFCLAAAVDWMWESTTLVITTLVLAAIAGAATTDARLGRWRPSGNVRISGSMLALLLLVVQLPPLLGTRFVRESQAAVRENRRDAALAAASNAVAAEPWGSSGYLQRALVLERWGQLAPAAADARRAVDREPANWRPWLTLARIEALRGRTQEAARAFREARRLNPTSPVFGEPAGSGPPEPR